MRMVRWMCGVKIQDRVPSKELRKRLGLDDIISVLQQNSFRWYGHELQKEDNDWVKKCMEYEVEDAMDRSRWRKQMGMIVDHDECEWVNVSSGTGSPGLSRTNSTEP